MKDPRTTKQIWADAWASWRDGGFRGLMNLGFLLAPPVIFYWYFGVTDGLLAGIVVLLWLAVRGVRRLDVGIRTGASERSAALRSELQSTTQDIIAAEQAIHEQFTATEPPNNLAELIAWQGGMKSLKQDLDRYENQIDRMRALLQRAISEDLAAERNQLIKLRQVYDLRKRRAEKLRRVADLVISSDGSPASMASLGNNLELLGSDIEGLERQDSELFAQIGTK